MAPAPAAATQLRKSGKDARKKNNNAMEFRYLGTWTLPHHLHIIYNLRPCAGSDHSRIAEPGSSLSQSSTKRLLLMVQTPPSTRLKSPAGPKTMGWTELVASRFELVSNAQTRGGPPDQSQPTTQNDRTRV